MNNEELDQRIRAMSDAIPTRERALRKLGEDPVKIELELGNMSLMTIWFILGEIAKRLPEARI